MSTADRRPATALDVARLAGVSRQAVSHILNGRDHKFPAETKNRVLVAAAELDYRPSPAARSLATGRNDTIVVVMPNTTWGRGIQEAIEQMAADLGSAATVLLRFPDPDPDVTIASILRLRPLAVVDFGSLLPPQRERLAAHAVPVVPDSEQQHQLGADRVEDMIGLLQVNELTKSGPRHIVFAGFNDDRSDLYGPGRMDGIIRACAEAGLAPPTRFDIAADLDDAVNLLRQITTFPLGIAAYNDTVALALLAAAAKLGIDVPGKLAIVGMDHTHVSQFWTPRLTTIAVDMRMVGEFAVRQIHERSPKAFKSLRTRSTVSTPSHRELLKLIPGEST